MSNTIAVYSLWRDSEPHIHRTLSQLEDLEALDYDFEYYFYENDSKDNTASILIDWTVNREGTLLMEDHLIIMVMVVRVLLILLQLVVM